jgi:hypothetical protein
VKSEPIPPLPRPLTPEQKLRTAMALYWSARNLKAAALRHQHPDWSEEKIQKTVREIFLTSSSLNG